MHIKIADYGISRIALPTGTKGFGGTEGFMAPEIICHNGEEEYTEKVIFSLTIFRSKFVSNCVVSGGLFLIRYANV